MSFNLKNAITQSYGRSSLVLKKHSPEILLAVGIAGGITAAILAVRATTKLPEVNAPIQETLKHIDDAFAKGETANGTVYTQETATQDKAKVYVYAGIQYAKLYGPAVGVGVLSITAILASHGIMQRRQVAVVAAYNLAKEALESYRKRVVEELGEDRDRQFLHGLREKTYTENEIDERDGRMVEVKKKRVVVDPNFKSQYARFFDETSPNWRNDGPANLYFLRMQQNWFNDLLVSRGHVFLNEVYEALGLPHTSDGAVVGWILRHDYEGMKKEGRDGYIDFDIYNLENGPGRAFVNGQERSILLDFNVDGVIYDLI